MTSIVDRIDSLVRPLLLRFEPETAHRLTVKALSYLPVLPAEPDDPRLAVKAFGLEFPNPLGLAAGFDKNAEVVDQILRLGFGFTEVGTVTPRPQPGNPRPRIFRLPEDRAVINRLGFNSRGHAAAHHALAARKARFGIVAVNLGANKDSQDRIGDYVSGIEAFADFAQMFVINISSPNTPGLRDLQHERTLDDLLARVLAARDAAPLRRPIIVKIAPDLTLDELDGVIRVCRVRGIDGLSVSNTTLSRPANLIHEAAAKEQGGLSGRPLFMLSTHLLAHAFLRVDNQFPLIGIGGVEDAATALAKIAAGASLIELYTALIFNGPRLVDGIKQGMIGTLMRAGAQHVADLCGTKALDWAAGKISAADLY